jgi:esterase FrsA
MAQGDRLYRENKKEEAYQCYNLGRFPYVYSDARQKSLAKCILSFNEWVQECGFYVEKAEINYQNQSIPVYLSGFDDLQKPVLFVIGGIVSLKEQWSPFLFLGPKLGCAVVVAEGPGVGENPLAYQPDSFKMISSVLDQLAPRANVKQTYMVGMSFGGYLGIQAALEDSRIQGITTVGAPLHHFFLDPKNWEQVPAITKKTLAYQCRVDEPLLLGKLKDFAISGPKISQLSIPLHYIFSQKDEIIPSEERTFLLNHVRNLELVEFDDIHGSPHHMGEIQKYIPLSILRQQKSKRIFIKIALHTALIFEKWKRKLGMNQVLGV